MRRSRHPEQVRIEAGQRGPGDWGLGTSWTRVDFTIQVRARDPGILLP